MRMTKRGVRRTRPGGAGDTVLTKGLSTALATVLATVLAGCATTLAGTPTPGGPGPATTDSQPTEDTQSSSPTQTSEPGPDRGELPCEGPDAISPQDQPFCFTLPQGFRPDDVNVETQAGSTASFTTGVVLSQRDLIIFSVYELGLDSDEATDQQLADALGAVIDQLAAQGVEFDSTEPVVQEVDGARAFVYTGTDASGLGLETYFIFRGFVELQVNCQWESMQTEVLAGCQEVLDSLQLTG